MNAVAKVDENATKLEMEAPAQPAAARLRSLRR